MKSWLVPVFAITLWEILVRLDMLSREHSAAPSNIIGTLVELIGNGKLFHHVRLSVFRLLAGVLLGATMGVSLGSYLALSIPVSRFLTPTITFLGGVPVIIWMPIWIMLFGPDEVFKVGLTATAVFFLVFLQAFQATKAITIRYKELADVYEKTLGERFVAIYLPASVVWVATSLRLSLSVGWIVLFFVEYASARGMAGGLGWFVADARTNGRVEDEFAGMFILAAIAFMVDYSVGRTQRRLTTWNLNLDSADKTQ